MRKELQKKIDMAIKLLQTLSNAYDNKEIEVAYSGGKDSDVILQLTRESGIPYRAIYKNTTIDPPGTIKHVQEMGVEIMRPKTTFFGLIKKKGMPSRFSRFCCYALKEYKILDKCIIGVRKEESPKRAKRYKEPTICFVYNKKEKAELIFPILDWTSQDIEEFIEERKIKCAPVYYDENGKFCAKKRLGCLCCPLQSKNKRIEEFKKYPKMVRAICNAEKIFFETHQQCVAPRIFEDVYEAFYVNLFLEGKPRVHNYSYNKEIPQNQRTDYKKFLQDYFNVKL